MFRWGVLVVKGNQTAQLCALGHGNARDVELLLLSMREVSLQEASELPQQQCLVYSSMQKPEFLVEIQPGLQDPLFYLGRCQLWSELEKSVWRWPSALNWDVLSFSPFV